jgi:hypothetical protein
MDISCTNHRVCSTSSSHKAVFQCLYCLWTRVTVAEVQKLTTVYFTAPDGLIGNTTTNTCPMHIVCTNRILTFLLPLRLTLNKFLFLWSTMACNRQNTEWKVSENGSKRSRCVQACMRRMHRVYGRPTFHMDHQCAWFRPVEERCHVPCNISWPLYTMSNSRYCSHYLVLEPEPRRYSTGKNRPMTWSKSWTSESADSRDRVGSFSGMGLCNN